MPDGDERGQRTPLSQNAAALLFERAKDPMCIVGSDGVIHSVNPAFVRSLGSTKEEFQGCPFYDGLHQADRSAVKTALEDLEDTVNVTSRHRGADGAYRRWAWHFVRVEAETWHGTARDVTADEARLDNAVMLERALDAMTDYVLIKGLKSRLLWANRAFRYFYGVTNQALKDQVDSPHADPDDTLQYVKNDHTVYTTGQTLDIPSESVTDKLGNIQHWHTIKNPVKSPDGTVTGLVVVGRAITQTDLLEQSEQDRADRKNVISAVRVLARDIPMPIVMLDASHRVIARSMAWSKLTQIEYPVEQLAPTFEELYEAQLPIVDLLVECGRSRTVQTRFEQPWGHEARRYFDIYVQPWFLNEDDFGGTIVLLQDVSRMKFAYQELERVNSELRDVSYRTSHDFVGPLKTVRGLLDALIEDAREGDLKSVEGAYGRITPSLDQLERVVCDLRRVSEAGFEIETNKEIDLANLVHRALATVRPMFEAHGISVDTDIDVGRLVAPEFRLREIVQSFATNAVAHRDPDEDTGHFSIEAFRDESRIVMWFRDNGVGFDAHETEHAFDMFRRAARAHNESGLGLYVAGKHVKHLRGAYRVVSGRKDTVFEVWFPAGPAPD